LESNLTQLKREVFVLPIFLPFFPPAERAAESGQHFCFEGDEVKKRSDFFANPFPILFVFVAPD